MKYIIISEFFPKYHPFQSRPTNFIKNIEVGFKKHTIRKAKRFKAGEVVNLKEWSGKPYCSKMNLIKTVEIVEVYDIEIKFYKHPTKETTPLHISINGETFSLCESLIDPYFAIENFPSNFLRLCVNDGLDPYSFYEWFKPELIKPTGFLGQIICWNKVDYLKLTTHENQPK